MAVRVARMMTRALSWTAGVLTGLVGWGGTRWRRGRQWLASARGGGADDLLPVLEADDPREELRRAILGRNRQQIAHVLGVPPTASVGSGVVLGGGPGGGPSGPAALWQAQTWYYPFDKDRRSAMAIKFVGDRAREVEFIGIPGEDGGSGA